MGREIHPAIRAEAFSEIGRQDDDCEFKISYHSGELLIEKIK